jgi:hypothetical protein
MKRKRHNKTYQQITVPCPRRLQKAMLKSMVNTIRSRLSKIRIQKTAALLVAGISTGKSKIIQDNMICTMTHE